MNKKSFAAFLAVSILSAGVCRAGLTEDASALSATGFRALFGAGPAQFQADVKGVKVTAPAREAAQAAYKAFELSCGGGKLQLQFKDARRFNALVNDAGIAAALRTAAAKFYEGEQRLVNVRFTGPASFMVADLQKNADGSGYDAGQFAPKVYLLGGGRAKLVLTYFRMNNSHSYDYNEVASFEFDNCVK